MKVRWEEISHGPYLVLVDARVVVVGEGAASNSGSGVYAGHVVEEGVCLRETSVVGLDALTLLTNDHFHPCGMAGTDHTIYSQ
jgi:hypothetical protein